jgi:hypothetical protein
LFFVIFFIFCFVLDYWIFKEGAVVSQDEVGSVIRWNCLWRFVVGVLQYVGDSIFLWLVRGNKKGWMFTAERMAEFGFGWSYRGCID